MKKSDMDESKAQQKLSGSQMWGCKANGCRLVAVCNGLCTFHDELDEFPNRWPFVTELINGKDFRTMLKATRHIMHYGDCGATRKEQAAALMRNAYRAGISLGMDKAVLNPITGRDGEKERFEPMARRYFYYMHKFVKETAMAQSINDKVKNLEEVAAKMSFEKAMDPNAF